MNSQMTMDAGHNHSIHYGPSWQAQVFRFGDFPPGVSARDLAPDNIRHMVHVHFEEYPPPDPRIHIILAAVFLFLGISSAVGNLLVLYVFGKYKSLRSPTNVLIMNLAFSDLMLFVGLYPELLGNIFFNNGPWMWGEIACKIHSFCGLAFGFSQMQTLQFIALDRYYVIVWGIKAKPLSYTRVVFWLFMIWIVSLFWALSPIFDIGHYSVDGLLSTCSFDFYSRDALNQLYIAGSCIHAYVIPLIVILFAYICIVRAVWRHEQELRNQAKKMNVTSLRCANQKEEDTTQTEWRIAKVALMNVTLWLFAWTPFTVISFVGVFGDLSLINPYVSSLPVIFAKTSAVYNPIIYALSHPRYQQCLCQEFQWFGARLNKGSKNSCNISTGDTETGSYS